MADNLLPGRYAVGAASVDAGGTIVTPTGANWTDNVWGDDLFFLPSQPLVPPQRVENVDPVDGTILLAYPWPGAAATEEAYEVRYIGIIERSTAQSRRVLEQLGDVKAWYDIIVADDASRLALESPGSPLRAGYRVLVKDDGVIWAKKTGGYGDWIGPVEFKGDIGNKGWSPVHGIVADGARRVWQLIEWVGGEGTAPAGAGKYVGSTGLVDTMAEATDVRGPAGLNGTGTGDVVGPASSVDSRMAEFSGTTGKLLKDSGVVVSAFVKTVLDDADAAAARTTLAAIGVVRRQVFTGSGTYTPHANLLYCEIECVGAGGGSGGLVGNASGHLASGAGGSGSVSRKIATAADIGVSKAVTVGAGGTAGAAGNNNGGVGGDSSVGTLCVGKGGSFGTGAQSAVNSGIGGAGGGAGTGDIAIPGQSGADGVAGTAVNMSPLQSIGGSTMYGWAAGAKSYSSVGTSGAGYGSGANGAVQTASASNLAGAAGRPGIVVITEYCSK